MMRSATLLILAALVALTLQLPYKHQLALVNSLEIGRDEDPNTWGCVGCSEENKPIHTYIIQEKSEQIKASLAVYEEYTILAFRYTANLKNVWQDLLFPFQVDFLLTQKQDDDAPAGCKVQSTYDGMWESIRVDVINDLKKYVHTTRLIITGISLGGGLACLSFVDIQASGEFSNHEVITFGSPRVGNKKWAKFFDSIIDSTRIYIYKDPINFLPRCLTPICNYSPVGTPVVCYPKKQECDFKTKGSEESYKYNYLVEQLIEHQDEIQDGEYGSIIDHIFGYKKIKDYTLVGYK